MTKIILPKLIGNPKEIYVLSDIAAKYFFNEEYPKIFKKYQFPIKNQIISKRNNKLGTISLDYQILDFKNNEPIPLNIFLKYNQRLNNKLDILIPSQKCLDMVYSIDEQISWHDALTKKIIRPEKNSNVIIYNIKNPSITLTDILDEHINIKTKKEIHQEVNSFLLNLNHEIKNFLSKRSAIYTRGLLNKVYTV